MATMLLVLLDIQIA